jgi:hypothetical protein
MYVCLQSILFTVYNKNYSIFHHYIPHIFTNSRRQIDPNPRYRQENILSVEMEIPDRTTQVMKIQVSAV